MQALMWWQVVNTRTAVEMKNVACVGLPYTQYKTPISNMEEQGRNIEKKLAKISFFLAVFSLRDNIINSCPQVDRSSVLASQYITLMKKKLRST